MRAFVLLIPLICSLIFVHAQNQDVRKLISNAKELRISLEDHRYGGKEKFPIKKIIVFDYRFDSSKISYTRVFTGVHTYRKVSLKTSWSSLLNNYFQENLDPSSPHTLLICIRSFWLKEGIVDDKSENKIQRQNDHPMADDFGLCKAVLDIYLQTDTLFQPMYKIEGAFINLYRFNYSPVSKWFFLPFDSMARKLANTDINEIKISKRKISETEIRSRYLERFRLPVLTNNIQKGVFLTFADFCNNKPMITELQFNEDKYSDELYIINNGVPELLTEYWGFFDGSDLFIKAGFSAFLTVRSQDTFEVFGAKYITNTVSNARPGDPIRYNKMKLNKQLLQLDMDSGKFY